MSYQAQAAVEKLDAKSVTSAERYMLWTLAYRHNIETDQCNPSLRFLEAQTSLSRHTIVKALEGLETKGIIFIRRDRDERGQISNQYDLLFLGGAVALPPSADKPIMHSGGANHDGGVVQSVPIGGAATAPEQGRGGTEDKRTESTPDTLGRVSAPKAGAPLKGFEEFSAFLSEHLPACKQSTQFWALVEIERARGVDLQRELHKMLVWMDAKHGRRKGTASFVLNWLEGAEVSSDVTARSQDYRGGPDRTGAPTQQRRPRVLRSGQTGELIYPNG